MKSQTNEQIFKRTLLYLILCLALTAFGTTVFSDAWSYTVFPTWILIIAICVCCLYIFKVQQKEGYLSYTSCIERYREYNERSSLKLLVFFIFIGFVPVGGRDLIIALLIAYWSVLFLDNLFKGTLPPIKDKTWREQQKKAFYSNIFIFYAWIMLSHTKKALQATLIAFIPIALLFLGFDNAIVQAALYIILAYAGIHFFLSLYLLL